MDRAASRVRAHPRREREAAPGRPVVRRVTAAGAAPDRRRPRAPGPSYARRRRRLPCAGTLARRFTDAGLAHPRPARARRRPGVTVVVPVRDRVADLDRCLAALGRGVPVVVVDDASRDAAAVARVCAEQARRSCAARSTAAPARHATPASRTRRTDVVAFVDSDCAPPPDWLDPLLAHLADPLVAAVAPRIVAAAENTGPGRYTRAQCSLDLGTLPARVMPRSRVSYVPTARCSSRGARAVDASSARFDERCASARTSTSSWRLARAGWRMRYEPSVQVDAPRADARWRQLLARRFRYGTSAGPLARRHPDAVSPLVLHPWPALTVAALLARRPVVAAGAFGTGLAAPHAPCAPPTCRPPGSPRRRRTRRCRPGWRSGGT